MSTIVVFSVVESLIEAFFFLKAKVSAKNRHGPWTFIGKHYKSSNRLTDNEQVHQQQRLPIIRKVIDHGDDEEAASSWWRTRNIDHGDDEEAASSSPRTRNMSVSFGPVYRGLEEETWKKAKLEAWQYVLRTSDDVGGADQTRDIVAITNDIYINAVRGIEIKSRALYGDGTGNDPIASLSSDEFIRIMILDGCFLLQVALFVLGGSKQMDYPIDVETFGVPPRNKELIRAVISSMFIVGNQIPILVLEELMKQSFFKKIVEQGKWQRPLDLERWVLFEQILVPMLDVKGGDIFIPTALIPKLWYIKRGFSVPPFRDNTNTGVEFICYILIYILRILIELGYYYISSLVIYIKKEKRKPPVIEADDLLKGLWLLMSGLSPRNKGGDLDRQINSDEKDDIEHSSYDVIHPTVRSATELKEAGITFMCIEGTRIKEILFKQYLFNAFLKLPKIIIGSEMESLFSNLIQYEVSREHLGQNRRKICAYLQLLSELIRTHDDVKLLAASGIIIVDPNEEEELPNMLRRLLLDIPKVNALKSLSKVRDQLNNYTRPGMYKKLGGLLSLVALLTIIQTVYSVLSYHSKK